MGVDPRAGTCDGSDGRGDGFGSGPGGGGCAPPPGCEGPARTEQMATRFANKSINY